MIIYKLLQKWSYCFIELESIFPTSSTRLEMNQNMMTALSLDMFWTRMVLSGASPSSLYGVAWPRQRQYNRCLTHLVQDRENWMKYAANTEHSFRTTTAPSPLSRDCISQPMILWSKSWASSSLSELLPGTLIPRATGWWTRDLRICI